MTLDEADRTFIRGLKAERDEAREESLQLAARSRSLEVELNEAHAKYLGLLQEKVQWVVEKNALKASCKERDAAFTERDLARAALAEAWSSQESWKKQCTENARLVDAARAERDQARTERDQARLQRDEALSYEKKAHAEYEPMRKAYRRLKDEADTQALAFEASRKALSEQVESLTKKFSLSMQRQHFAIEQMYETAYQAATQAIRDAGGYFGSDCSLNLKVTIQGLGELL
jgi:hypothetical protein